MVKVYPLSNNDVYDAGQNKFFALKASTDPDESDDPKWVITLAADSNFDEESPTRRIYFTGNAVSYCAKENAITRHSNYTRDSDGMPIETSTNKGVLMADLVDVADGSPFNVIEATLVRNAIVSVKLKFHRIDEDIYFNNEIQVPNVP